MARMHDESLTYVLSDNAIVALAKKVPATEADISTTISQADTRAGVLNSNSTTGSPSWVVTSHLVDICFLLQGELQTPDEILQFYINKHLGPNGSCPVSLYNHHLLSPRTPVSEEKGYSFSKKVSRTNKSRKSPVLLNCKVYAKDGTFLWCCGNKKQNWYLEKNLAEPLFDEENKPAIRLLFEPEGVTLFAGEKENKCVGCGEGNNYERHHIIPECYRIHFPEHVRSLRWCMDNVVLVCPVCKTKALSLTEANKKKVASEFGVSLFPHKVVNSSGGSVSPSEAARVLLNHGSKLPPQRREELRQVVKKHYGGREISDEDMSALAPPTKKQMLRKRRSSRHFSSKKTVSDTPINSDIDAGPETSRCELDDGCCMLDSDINSDPKESVSSGLTCTSTKSLYGHGPHGKQVVDYLLKEHGEDGIQKFCQRWRQVFVEAINPRFLPQWQDRAWGLNQYNHSNKGSPSAAKDLTVQKG